MHAVLQVVEVEALLVVGQGGLQHLLEGAKGLDVELIVGDVFVEHGDVLFLEQILVDDAVGVAPAVAHHPEGLDQH